MCQVGLGSCFLTMDIWRTVRLPTVATPRTENGFCLSNQFKSVSEVISDWLTVGQYSF
jgi:hypothetical protein